MANGKAGRPTKNLTDAQRAEVETLAAVLSTEQMAGYFGMSHDTFTAICEREPEVFRAYKRGKSKAIGKVAQGLIQKALAGDTTSAIFFLKTQGRWSETQKLEHSGPDGSPLFARIERVIVDGSRKDDAED
jgi:hypothetical protein